MSRIGALIATVIVLLTGCITPNVGKDFKFDYSKNHGLIAILNPPPIISAEVTYMVLMKLNYEERTLGEVVKACSNCMRSVDIFDLEHEHDKYKLAYLEPGDYTIFSLASVQYGGQRFTNNKLCKGSPAFRVEAGKVTLIDLGSRKQPQLKYFTEAIKQKTNIAVPVSMAKRLSVISFDCDINTAILFYEEGLPFKVSSE